MIPLSVPALRHPSFLQEHKKEINQSLRQIKGSSYSDYKSIGTKISGVGKQDAPGGE